MDREVGRYRDVSPTFWLAIGLGVLHVAVVALRHPFGALRDVAWLWLVQLGGALAGLVLIARLFKATAELITREVALPAARIAAPGA